MRIAVGPVSSASARAWLAYARTVVDEIATGPEARRLPPDLLVAFDTYLAAWDDAATADEFRWETDIPAEEVEYHVHAFHRVVTRLADEAERRGEALQPEAGEPFYNALVIAILGALEREGPPANEFAEQLRAFWPGFVESELDDDGD